VTRKRRLQASDPGTSGRAARAASSASKSFSSQHTQQQHHFEPLGTIKCAIVQSVTGPHHASLPSPITRIGECTYKEMAGVATIHVHA